MLFLCRHGQTEWNAQGRVQGSKDSPLTELGKQQMLRVGLFLNGMVRDKVMVYSSSLGRAMQSAKIVSSVVAPFRSDFCELSLLNERDHGIWEGQLHMSLDTMFDRTDYHKDKWNYKGHSGESYKEFMHRVSELMKIGFHSSSWDTIVVSHQTTVRFIVSYIMGLDPNEGPSIVNDEVVVIPPSEDTFLILRAP